MVPENSGLLSVALIEEMYQAFRRGETLLDLDMQNNNVIKEEQVNTNKSNLQPTQMVVPIDQAEALMSQGWRFVGTFPNDKISG